MRGILIACVALACVALAGCGGGSSGGSGSGSGSSSGGKDVDLAGYAWTSTCSGSATVVLDGKAAGQSNVGGPCSLQFDHAPAPAAGVTYVFADNGNGVSCHGTGNRAGDVIGVAWSECRRVWEGSPSGCALHCDPMSLTLARDATGRPRLDTTKIHCDADLTSATCDKDEPHMHAAFDIEAAGLRGP